MPEVANRDVPLNWDVLVTKRQGLTRDLPHRRDPAVHPRFRRRSQHEHDCARELYEQMLELYPDRANPGPLWGSARAVKG